MSALFGSGWSGMRSICPLPELITSKRECEFLQLGETILREVLFTIISGIMSKGSSLAVTSGSAAMTSTSQSLILSLDSRISPASLVWLRGL